MLSQLTFRVLSMVLHGTVSQLAPIKTNSPPGQSLPLQMVAPYQSRPSQSRPSAILGPGKLGPGKLGPPPPPPPYKLVPRNLLTHFTLLRLV